MNLVEIFKALVKIPSPSFKEKEVADKIRQMLTEAGVENNEDFYGNVVARIAPTDLSKESLLLSSHMDVVGDMSPVNIIEADGFIQTDKTRTLGADNKAGVAAIIELARDIVAGDFSHGGVEIVFTRDEEFSMTGVSNVEFEGLKSKYALVLDSHKLGQFEIAGASFMKLSLGVKTFFGGHSGLDIDDESKLNAVKLIAELVNEIPQGVYKKDDLGVIASINVGAIIGGGVHNAVCCYEQGVCGDCIEYVCENSMSNIINTHARALYSLRSSSVVYQNELIEKIKFIVSEFNKKYSTLAVAELDVEEHLPVFEKSKDDFMVKIAQIAAQKSGVELNVSTFHAGAETHIYANRKNSNGESFVPVLMGIADIYNMHSNDEKINVESYIKGFEFLKVFFKEFNAQRAINNND